MSVHQMVTSRPSNIHGYYPATSSHAPMWQPSTLSCPITSSHDISQSYSTPTYSRSEQLLVRIHENHLSYLSREETPTKLDLLAKLHALIADFLSIVPHKQKFGYKEIGECLTQSIRKKPDFSPIKAIAAFEDIEKYATNILNFPWRHEFQTIYSFSGYFRVIESSLVRVRPIFELLGFAFDSSTSVFKLIEVPIDPDKVSRVALDCLVAIGECKMMLSIYNLAKKDFPNLSWNDIHSIRLDNICNIEGSLKLLSDLNTTRLIDLDLPDYSMKKFNKLDMLSPANGASRTLFDSCSSTTHILPPPSNYLESNLDSFEFIDSKSEELMSPLSPPSTYFQANRQPSSQLPQQPLSPPPSFMSVLEPVRASFTTKAPVKENLPSSRIDSQPRNSDINTTSTTLAYNYDNGDNNSNADGKHQSTKKSAGNEGKKNNSIDPDRLLAEINQFDQHNRRNGSSPPSSVAKSKNAFSVEKKAFKVSTSGDKGTEIDGGKTIVVSADRLERGRSLNIVNRYPKNAKQEVVPSLQQQEPEEISIATITLPINAVSTTTTTTSSATPLATSSLAPLKVKVANLPTSAVVKLNGPSFASSWACKSCTYINSNGDEVCKMCHKSRSLGNESTPLVSGGRECSRCTLVNAKDDMFCNACNTSLADSPTYI